MSSTLFPLNPILIVDDESGWLRSLALLLERLGGINHVETCDDSAEVMARLQQKEYSLVLLDNAMPGISGLDLLQQLTEEHPSLAVVMLTALDRVELAVECMRRGAHDYFVKTMEDERLVAGVQKALRMQEMARESRRLRDGMLSGDLEHPDAFSDIVSVDPGMRSLFHYIEAIAHNQQPVLLTGESGTGKEMLARSLHQIGRPDGPWLPVNVAGLDDGVFADTLFGHARGAFTDADQARPGMIERAKGGTLYLDGVATLNLDSQAKLLRVVQNGEYYALGSDRPRRVEARIVASANKDLIELQEAGEFRKDLYFSLCTHHLHVPPLRERKGDLPLLLDAFLAGAAEELSKVKPTPPQELITLLGSYSFPGNVVELRAMVYDAVALHRGRKLSMEAFKRSMGFNSGVSEVKAVSQESPVFCREQLPTIQEAIGELVEEALRRADNNQGIAAGMLGISRPALNRRLQKRKESHH